ncbi:MAG: methionine synthase [Halobacteria archaeon]|nr:methionine synthase [Halobacteria archaeon]
MDKLFPTTVIGSHPKPKWLNRVRDLYEEGEFDEERMQEAFDDAARLIVNEHERAGIEILSDGEMRRNEMVEYFAERIPGYEFNGPVRVWGNNYFDKPSVVNELGDPDPMLVDEFEFTREVADEEFGVKVPITGPYTLYDWSFDEVYDTQEELVMRLAEIVNDEVKRLADAGAEYIQIDEPALSTRPEDIDLVIDATEKVVEGIDVERLIMHVCYGDYSTIYPEMLDIPVDQFSLEFVNQDFAHVDTFAEHEFTKEIGFGCVDVHENEVESVEEIKDNIRNAFEFVDPEQVWVNPDCGVKLLPRETAFEKLENMSQAARELREEHS